MKRSTFMKLISVFLVLVLALSAMVGCGGEEEPDETLPAKQTKTPYKDAGEIDYEFAKTGTYTNKIKVIRNKKPNEVEEVTEANVGDPFVMKYNGKYYLYPSSDGGENRAGMRVYVSDDMINWQDMGPAIPTDDKTIESRESSGAYAPEVVYYNGLFYLIHAQYRIGHMIYVSDNPLNGFKLISDRIGHNSGSIDGYFYVDDNGELFFFSSQMEYRKFFDLSKLKGSQEGISNAISVANVNMGPHWTEGPGMIRRGDYTYFTYTGNHILSSGYKIGYSYAENMETMSGNGPFIRPEYSTLLINTGNLPQYQSIVPEGQHNGGLKRFNLSTTEDSKGLGHSSNFNGPDLDSIYTAYHNLNHWDLGDGTESGLYPSRSYNLDRYMSNGMELMANGITSYAVAAPKRPDFETEGSQLDKIGNIQLSKPQTGAVYTTEQNFKLKNSSGSAAIIVGYQNDTNYYEIVVNATEKSIALSQTKNGVKTELGRKELSKNSNFSALSTVRVESGYDRSFIYLNGMRVIAYADNIGGGKIGYDNNIIPQYTAFSNDVFGTSDFDTVKNLPTQFPAMSYIKGENRGFKIAEAEPKKGGMRQGESESSRTVGKRTALVMETKGDYVKYAVNAGKSGQYALHAEVSDISVGTELEVIVDNKVKYDMIVPEGKIDEDGFAKLFLGRFELTAGEHVIKLKIKSGTLEAINFAFEKDAEIDDDFSNELTQDKEGFFDFYQDVVIDKNGNKTQEGTYKVTADGAKSANASSLLLFGSTGNANYTFSMDYKLDSGDGSNGIVFRMKNFAEYPTYNPVSDAMQGYYLKIFRDRIELWRNNYDQKTLLSSYRTTLFSGGKSQNIKIEVNQNTINVLINEIYVMQEIADSNAFLSGQLGLYSKDAVVVVKNFEYRYGD